MRRKVTSAKKRRAPDSGMAPSSPPSSNGRRNSVNPASNPGRSPVPEGIASRTRHAIQTRAPASLNIARQNPVSGLGNPVSDMGRSVIQQNDVHEVKIHVGSRFSSSRIHGIVDNLKPEQEAFLKNSAFRSLLGVSKFNVPTDLLEWLMKCTRPHMSDIFINGISIPITKAMVNRIIGFREGTLKINKSSKDPDHIRIVNDLKEKCKGPGGYPIGNVVNLCKAEMDEVNFLRSFMLVAISTMFFPRKDNSSRVDYVFSLIDVTSVEKYDWADAIIRLVFNEIKRYQSMLTSEDAVTSVNYFEGFLPLLAIIYLDFIDLSGLSHKVNYDTPRICNVTGEDFQFIVNNDKNPKSVTSFGHLPIRDISQTPYSGLAENHAPQVHSIGASIDQLDNTGPAIHHSCVELNHSNDLDAATKAIVDRVNSNWVRDYKQATDAYTCTVDQLFNDYKIATDSYRCKVNELHQSSLRDLVVQLKALNQSNADTNDRNVRGNTPDGNGNAHCDNVNKDTSFSDGLEAVLQTAYDAEHRQGHFLVGTTSRGRVSTQPSPAASDSDRASGGFGECSRDREIDAGHNSLSSSDDGDFSNQFFLKRAEFCGRSPGDTRGLVSSVAVDSIRNSLINALVINTHESNDKSDDCPSANHVTLTDSTNGTAQVFANELPVSPSLGSIAQRKRKLSFEGSPTCVQQGPDGNLSNVMSPISCNPFESQPIDLGPGIQIAMQLDSDCPAAATPRSKQNACIPSNDDGENAKDRYSHSSSTLHQDTLSGEISDDTSPEKFPVSQNFSPPVGTSTLDKMNRKRKKAKPIDGNNVATTALPYEVELFYSKIASNTVRRRRGTETEDEHAFIKLGDTHVTYPEYYQSVKGRRGVNENVMCAYTMVFNHDNATVPSDLSLRKRISFSPFLVKKLIVDNVAFDHTSCVPELKRMEKSLTFSNAHLNHWVLACINRLHKTINFFDSADVVTNDEITMLLNNLVQNFSKSCVEAGIFKYVIQYEEFRPHDYPKQPNTKDGIYVICYMHLWDGQAMKSFHKTYVDQQRKVLAHTLVHTKLNVIDSSALLLKAPNKMK